MNKPILYEQKVNNMCEMFNKMLDSVYRDGYFDGIDELIRMTSKYRLYDEFGNSLSMEELAGMMGVKQR